MRDLLISPSILSADFARLGCAALTLPVEACTHVHRTLAHIREAGLQPGLSIEPGSHACAAVRQVEGKRFLASSAPMLPLPNCGTPRCACKYQHYQDRRTNRDRRVNFANPHAHTMSDRRANGGWRFSD